MSGVGPPQRTFAPAPRSRTASSGSSSPGQISRNTRASTPSVACARSSRASTTSTCGRQRRQLVDVDDHAERRVEALGQLDEARGRHEEAVEHPRLRRAAGVAVDLDRRLHRQARGREQRRMVDQSRQQRLAGARDLARGHTGVVPGRAPGEPSSTLVDFSAGQCKLTKR